MTTSNLSLRVSLKGHLDDLLKDEEMICAHTCSALVAIVAQLSDYVEEGAHLHPEVYVCEDIDLLSSRVQGSEVIRLGSGTKCDSTVLLALKVAAPLATGGWAIFIERAEQKFSYGLIRSAGLPLEITLGETLVDFKDETLFIVVARQVAKSCVEIKGSRGSSTRIYFSAERTDDPLPDDCILNLAKKITQDCPAQQKEDTERFCYRVLLKLLPELHGTLVAVISKRNKKLPMRLKNAVVIEPPIRFSDCVADYKRNKDEESVSKLAALEAILKGMLESDGITVFRSDSTLLGYRAFVPLTCPAPL
ncbi:MAG: hypothetical protein HOA58_08435 [Rhodospirillaceae bacterium]|nr:hypothetical protein [Rhodospirillaceae bacterium]